VQAYIDVGYCQLVQQMHQPRRHFVADAEAPAKALEDVLLQRCAPGHIRVIEAQ